MSFNDRSMSFWDFVPIVGSMRNLKHAAEDFEQGNPVQGLLNTTLGVGGLVLDGLTLGSASLIKDGIKVGVQQGIKKGTEKLIITKSAEIGVKALGVAASGYAVKSVASPVVNHVCDETRDFVTTLGSNSGSSSSRPSNSGNTSSNTSSNSGNTSNRSSSGQQQSSQGRSQNNSNYNNSNNNNNNNQNNNNSNSSSSNPTQNRREQTREWLRQLNIQGINVDQLLDHELDRLGKVRAEMMTYESSHSGFMTRAVDFVRSMNPNTSSKFCSFLNAFATEFRSMRDTLMQNQNLTRKDAGNNALGRMTNDFMKTIFNQVLNTVRTHRMAYTYGDRNPHPNVRVNMQHNDLIRAVRQEAGNNNIRFGSEEAAAYHIRKHPIGPDETQYVNEANALIGHPNTNVRVRVNNDGTVDMEFLGPKTNYGRLFCVVLVTNGKIILKTLYYK